jgi:hypothetical protein
MGFALAKTRTSIARRRWSDRVERVAQVAAQVIDVLDADR